MYVIHEFSASHTWVCTRSWDGTQLEQLTPTDHWDIPYHKTLCLAYKAGGRRRREGVTFGVMVFGFSRNHYTRWSPALLRMAEDLLPMGSGECISCLTLLVYAAFTLPTKLSLLQLTFFSHFYLFSSHLTRTEWTSSSVGLSCQLELNYDTLPARFGYLIG